MKNLTNKLWLALFIFSSSLSAQLPDFQVSVIDDHFSVGDNDISFVSPPLFSVNGGYVISVGDIPGSDGEVQYFFDGENITVLNSGPSFTYLHDLGDGGVYQRYSSDQHNYFYLAADRQQFIPLPIDGSVNSGRVAEVNGRLVITLSNGSAYSTDGTVAGTELLYEDIDPSYVRNQRITALGDIIAINNLSDDRKLYFTDGTSAGTYQVAGGGNFTTPVAFNGRYCFSGSGFVKCMNATGAEVDTLIQTVGIFNDLKVIEERLVFMRYSVSNFSGLYTSGGAAETTERLYTIPPPQIGVPTDEYLYSAAVANRFFHTFFADDDPAMKILYTDGTIEGTDTLNIPGAPSEYMYFTEQVTLANGDGYVTIYDPTSGTDYIYYVDPAQPDSEPLLLLTLDERAAEARVDSEDKYYVRDAGDLRNFFVLQGSVAGPRKIEGPSQPYFIREAGQHLLYYHNSTDYRIVPLTGTDPILLSELSGTGINLNWHYGLFELNGETYGIAQSGPVGVAIYKFRPDTGFTELVTDIFLSNEGIPSQGLIPTDFGLIVGRGSIWKSNGEPGGSVQFPSPALVSGFEELANTTGQAVISERAQGYVFTDGTEAGTFAYDLGLNNITTNFTVQGFQGDIYVHSHEVISDAPGGDARMATALLRFTAGNPVPAIVLQDTIVDVFGQTLDYQFPELGTDGEHLYYYRYTPGDFQTFSGIFNIWRTDGTDEGEQITFYTPGGDGDGRPLDFTSGRDQFMYYGYGTQGGLGEVIRVMRPGYESPQILSTPLFFSDELEKLIELDNYTIIQLSNSLLSVPRNGLVSENFYNSDSPTDDIRFVTPVLNDQAIFADEFFDPKIWITDGSEQGTRLLPNFQPADGDRLEEDFAHLNGITAIITETGVGQIRTLHLYNHADSTAYIPELPGTDPHDVVVYNDRIYFFLNHELYGEELHFLSFEEPAEISGLLYRDTNQNGAYDPGEPGLGNRPVYLSGTNQAVVFSREDGRYRYLPSAPGPFTVNAFPDVCWRPTGQDFYSGNTLEGNFTDLNFGYYPETNTPALRTIINSTFTRCNANSTYWITVINSGCADLEDVVVRVTYPFDLDFIEANFSSSSNHPDYTFAVGDLLIGESKQVEMIMQQPSFTQLGRIMEATSFAEAVTSDQSFVSSPFFEYREELRCAYDPNDKRVFPARPDSSNSNYTQVDEMLLYTIRFQNTGTDTAFNVRIEDQLSTDLEWGSFRPLAASHEYSTVRRNDGTVIFNFENIMLPDSNVNERASHGFVQFEIMPRFDLPDFTEITNTAHIFFDFNPAIVTNSTLNTSVTYLDEDQDGFFFWEECDDQNENANPDQEEIIDNDVDEDCDGIAQMTSRTNNFHQGELSVYPNPTNDYLQLDYSSAEILNIKLMDLHGRPVIVAQLRNRLRLDLSQLITGTYILEVSATNGQQHRELISKF